MDEDSTRPSTRLHILPDATERNYVENDTCELIPWCMTTSFRFVVTSTMQMKLQMQNEINLKKNIRSQLKKKTFRVGLKIKDIVKFLPKNVNNNVLFCFVQYTQVPLVSTNLLATNRPVSLPRSEMSEMRTIQRRFGGAKLSGAGRHGTPSYRHLGEHITEGEGDTAQEERGHKRRNEVTRDGGEGNAADVRRMVRRSTPHEDVVSSDSNLPSSEREEQRRERIKKAKQTLWRNARDNHDSGPCHP